MHLIVPFAAPLSDAGRQALRSLALPTLETLLPLLGRHTRDDGDEFSLSPPHERALARALGLAGADGCLPWAAHAAAQAGIDTDDLAWGRLTPVHLHVGDQVSLLDPAALALDEHASRALFDTVAPLFTSEGFAMLWLAPHAWLAAHESLRDLPTASTDRVIGRPVDRWLPDARAAAPLGRLLNEAQMLLYTHAVNDAREARGLRSVNALWLSGCGALQSASQPPGLVVDAWLRAGALAEDWAAWREAWQALDAGPVADLHAAARRGEAVSLTLCGERSALHCAPAPRGRWQRWFGPRRADAAALLETL